MGLLLRPPVRHDLTASRARAASVGHPVVLLEQDRRPPRPPRRSAGRSPRGCARTRGRSPAGTRPCRGPRARPPAARVRGSSFFSSQLAMKPGRKASGKKASMPTSCPPKDDAMLFDPGREAAGEDARPGRRRRSRRSRERRRRRPHRRSRSRFSIQPPTQTATCAARETTGGRRATGGRRRRPPTRRSRPRARRTASRTDRPCSRTNRP